MNTVDLYLLLKLMKTEDFLIIKTNAVQYLINSGRIDEDASAAAWAIAVTDRLNYMQNKLVSEAKATAEAEDVAEKAQVEGSLSGDKFDPWNA